MLEEAHPFSMNWSTHKLGGKQVSSMKLVWKWTQTFNELVHSQVGWKQVTYKKFGLKMNPNFYV